MIPCFALFLLGVGTCLVTGHSLVWALSLGLVLFSLLALRRGYQPRQVAAMLKKRDGLNSSDHVGTRRYFASDSAADFAALASIFLGRDITGAVEQVDITKY